MPTRPLYLPPPAGHDTNWENLVGQEANHFDTRPFSLWVQPLMRRIHTCPSLIKSGKKLLKNLVIDFFHFLSSSVPVMRPGFLTRSNRSNLWIICSPSWSNDVFGTRLPAFAAESGRSIVRGRSTLPRSDLHNMISIVFASSVQRPRWALLSSLAG